MLNPSPPNLAVCLNSFMSLCRRFNTVCFCEEVCLRVVCSVSSCTAYLRATFKLFLCSAFSSVSEFVWEEFSWDLCEIRRCLEERVRRHRWPPVAPQLCQHPRLAVRSTNHFPFTLSFKSVPIFNSSVCPSTPPSPFLTVGATINAPPTLLSLFFFFFPFS